MFGSVLRLGSRSGSEQLHTLASVKSAMKEHKLRGGAMHAAFKQGIGSLLTQPPTPFFLFLKPKGRSGH